MSTASSLQQPASTAHSPTAEGPEESQGRSPHAETRASGFRIGFFFRKIRNGEIVYEKRFPSYGRSTLVALAPEKEKASSSIDGPGSRPAAPHMMMAAGQPDGGGSLDDSANTQDGTGLGNDNPGPIGGTSYEIGAFAGTLTTS